MAHTKSSTDEGFKQRSPLEQKTLNEEYERLVAAVTERLLAPQRVKVSLDDLDSVSEND